MNSDDIFFTIFIGTNLRKGVSEGKFHAAADFEVCLARSSSNTLRKSHRSIRIGLNVLGAVKT